MHCLWPLLLHRGSIWCWSLSQPLYGDGGVTQGHIVIHNHPHLALTVKYSQPEVQSLLMHIYNIKTIALVPNWVHVAVRAPSNESIIKSTAIGLGGRWGRGAVKGTECICDAGE